MTIIGQADLDVKHTNVEICNVDACNHRVKPQTASKVAYARGKPAGL